MNPFHAMKAYIQGHGWYQGYFYGPNGTVCMLGAMHKSIEKKEYFISLAEVLDEVLHEQYPELPWFMGANNWMIDGSFNPVPYVNDRVMKSVDEVYAILDKAAVKWGEQNGSS